MTTKRRGLLAALAAICCTCGITLPTTSVLAADVFRLGTTSGNAGSTGVELPLTATHDVAIQGFSLSVSFNSTLLSMTGLSFVGTETETVTSASGGVPEYVGVTIDNGAGTMVAGVIFGFSPVPPLSQLPQIPASPTTESLLAKLLFDIAPGALPTDLPIVLDDGLGNPAVDNVYSNDGFSHVPALVDGLITVNNLHRFYFNPMQVVPGGSLGATMLYDHEDPMAGFVISLSWESGKLLMQMPVTNEGWWAGTTLQSSLNPDTIEFFDVKTQPAFPQPGVGYLALIAQFDFLPPFHGQTVPVGDVQSLVRLNFNVANNPGLIGQTTHIHFENTISPAPPPPTPGNPNPAIPPPTANLVVTNIAAGITPVQEDGVVQILDLMNTFVRGNPNGDSAVNLADAIYMLQFLFSSGSPPICMDAGDINDDGLHDISDAISVIGYLFTDGPEPRHPFPGCGVDFSPDSFPACSTGLGNCP